MFLVPELALCSGPSPSESEAGMSPETRAVQVLSRLTFGARPGDVDRIIKTGIDAFISEQLDPDSIDDSALQSHLNKLPTLNLATPFLAEQYNVKPPPKPSPSPTAANAATAQGNLKPAETSESLSGLAPTPSPTPKPAPTPTPKNPQMVISELQRAKLLRAVYSQRQLNEVMVDFWENHFSIYGNKDATRWMLTAFDRDTIRPFAMGRFRDLLGATAHSPAMLFYLDNWQSSQLRKIPATKDRPERTYGGINENYARELMELHTLGVDGGYTQKDVQEVARCFTGWSIRKPAEEGLFVFNPNAHDNGEKTVLGVKIPAGGGIKDGERVLDILSKSPATAKFISTKLATRFLGDAPPAAVVDRAASVFLASDGSIPETLKSIITSSSFFSQARYRNKVKSPFEYVVSALRATGAVTDGNRPILDWISRMGQPVFGRVTPDGYPDASKEWLSNNDMLSRFNFATALSLNQIRGTRIDASKLAMSSGQDLRPAAAIVGRVIPGEVSDKTRMAIEKLAEELAKSRPVTPVSNPIRPAATSASFVNPATFDGQLVALALGSPEFQRK